MEGRGGREVGRGEGERERVRKRGVIGEEGREGWRDRER